MHLQATKHSPSGRPHEPGRPELALGASADDEPIGGGRGTATPAPTLLVPPSDIVALESDGGARTRLGGGGGEPRRATSKAADNDEEDDDNAEALGSVRKKFSNQLSSSKGHTSSEHSIDRYPFFNHPLTETPLRGRHHWRQRSTQASAPMIERATLATIDRRHCGARHNGLRREANSQTLRTSSRSEEQPARLCCSFTRFARTPPATHKQQHGTSAASAAASSSSHSIIVRLLIIANLLSTLSPLFLAALCASSIGARAGGPLASFASAAELRAVDGVRGAPPDISEPNWAPIGGETAAAWQRAASPSHRKQRHRHSRYNHHHHARHYRGQPPQSAQSPQQQQQQQQQSPPFEARANRYNHKNKKVDTRGANERHRRHFGGANSADYLSPADRPVVATRKGLVRGVTQRLSTGKSVDAFLGIPFAQPPVGKYRFRHPQPNQPWQGELDASRFSASCYQVNDTFFGDNFLGTSVWNPKTSLSEDCLYLNIWTPFGAANASFSVPPEPSSSRQPGETSNHNNHNHKIYRSSSAAPPSDAGNASFKGPKRPVLVWIFGGGFSTGTSTLALYEGGILASEEDIIVVSVNYRVNALGFLYFARPDAPGNAGLFDQLLALQWINDNIDQFGGDPQRVTLFGESAGAVSIAFHLLSPLSRNLFSQAILQSGGPTCPWGYKEAGEMIANGLQLASLLNCPGSAAGAASGPAPPSPHEGRAGAGSPTAASAAAPPSSQPRPQPQPATANRTDLDAVLDCLLKADPMALVSQEVGQNKVILKFPFVPVIDGSFLIESPAESLIKANFKPAKILLGSNNDEGNFWLVYYPEFSHCSAAPPPPNGGGAPMAASAPPLPSAEQHGEPLESGSAPDQQQRYGPLGGHAPMDLTMAADDLVAAAAVRGAAMASVHHLSATETTASGQQEPDAPICMANETLALTRDDFFAVLKEDHLLNAYAEHPIGREALAFEYSDWGQPSVGAVSNNEALDKIVGDFYFTCHVNEFAYRYASAGNPVYMYYFRQQSSISPWPRWMGVLHGDEISYVFGEPLKQLANYTAKEVDLSRRMMRYWSNFAKFGNPTKTSDNSSLPERWPEYSADKKQYFELHADLMRVGRGPRAKECAFWSYHMPKLLDSYDRNQCSAAAPTRHHMIHPLGLKYAEPSQRNAFLSAVPAPLVVFLCLILVLTILGLLYYTRKSLKLDLGLSGSSSGNGANSDN